MEATGDPGNESNQVRNQTVQGTPVGQCKQRILGSRRKRYNAASGTHMQPSQSRLSLPNGLLCSIAQNVRNRRMPNGTYGGVRGRETKEIGGKLQESFVFLLLDYFFENESFNQSIMLLATLSAASRPLIAARISRPKATVWPAPRPVMMRPSFATPSLV